MSKANPTKFEKKGMELYRNDVHIATREPNEVVIIDGCQNFEMIATKMLNSKAFCKEHGLDQLKDSFKKPKKQKPILTTETQVTVEEPPVESNETIDRLLDANKTLTDQVEALMEMNANRIDTPATVNTVTSDSSIKDAEMAKKDEQIAILQAQVQAKSNVYTLDVKEETPFLIDRDDVLNPFKIPEDVFADAMAHNVPPCPQMDWRGTKTPEVLAWYIKFFPKHSKARLSKFRLKQEIKKKKEAKDKAQEIAEAEERAKRPKSDGNTFPYQIQES